MQVQTSVGKTFACAFIVVFAVFWIIGISREYWGVRMPDDAHPYGVRFRGGVLFFTPVLGWFLNHALWILFSLLAVITVTEWLHRGANSER